MSESRGDPGPNLLVATADQSLASAVGDAVERADRAASAERLTPATAEVSQRDIGDADGAIVDGQIAEPVAVTERFVEEWGVPVVVLSESGWGDDTIARVIEAGATDVFPRTTASEQYGLVVDRFTTGSIGQRESPYGEAYEALFEKISEGLVVHEPTTGVIVDVNERFCEMNGYERSELIGEPIGTVMTDAEPYGPQTAKEMIRQARTEGPQRFEWRNQRRSGETFPVEVDLTVIELDGEERVLASVTDITERKRREQEYEQIFNSVQDAITVHDPTTGEMVDVNDTFCDLVGYDRETILEMGTTGISVPAEGYTEAYAEEVIAEVMSEGQKGPYEWMVETSDGDRRITEVVATRGEISGEERIISINRDITERKRREREYEQIFDGVNDPIAVFDPDTGEITEVNEPYHEMIGYDGLETIQELGIEGLSAAGEAYTGERGVELVREVSETGDPKTVEWEAETADGERRYLDITLSPAVIRGEERVLSIQRDVTERKRREQEYEQIFDSVQDAITVFDPDAGEITEVNDAYKEMFGYGLERIRELGIEGLSVGEEGYTGERGWELIREVAQTGDSETTEWRAETSDGDRIWLEVTMTSAEIGGEQRVLSIQRDVTERKRREQEYEQIFNGVQDAIAVFDPETLEFLDANDAYLEMFDHESVSELRERGVSGLSITEEGYTEQRGREVHQRVLENDEAEIVEWQGETSTGERVWLEVKVAPVVIGGEQRTVSIQRDITERKRRKQRLEVFNRILRHNLRNRLDVIQSHAEALGDRTTDDHAARIVAAVNDLAGVGRRARRVDRILSRENTLTELDVTQMLRETAESMDATERDITVRTDFPNEARLRTDEESITMAVESALENALGYASSTVTVAVDDRPAECVITIADDGPGIPAEELTPIEAQTETRLQHGRGLGLWQLRWCVDTINGELTVETDAGTTVRITVPKRRKPSA